MDWFSKLWLIYVKLNNHIGQITFARGSIVRNGFTPLWLRICVVKLTYIVNAFWQREH